MKKSEIAKSLDLKATAIFMTTAIALVINSLVNNLIQAFELSAVAENIGLVVIIISSIFAYVMTVKGFSVVNKACKLSEKNENYYMGKNLTVFAVVCIVMSVILNIVAMVFSVSLAQYNYIQDLTAADIQARNNLFLVTALINIAMQFFAISTPYIFYLWKIYKITSESKAISNVSLLVVIVMVVHLVIGVLNAMYTVKGDGNAFLPGFSSVLSTIKYLVLFVFFMIRRKNLLAESKEEII